MTSAYYHSFILQTREFESVNKTKISHGNPLTWICNHLGRFTPQGQKNDFSLAKMDSLFAE